MNVAEPKSMSHPSRSSSLNHGRPAADMPYAQPAPSGQVIFENGQYQDRPLPNQSGAVNTAKNGLQDLASVRAQLLAIQRRLLEHTGKTLGWTIGWGAILKSLDKKEPMTDIDINDDATSADAESAETEPGEEAEHEKERLTSTLGIVAGALMGALTSIEQFRQFYEVRLILCLHVYGSNQQQSLSDLIVKHYMAAGQTKSAESVLGDLAALR
jgi:hypothetical protein